tara:strand:- start:1000 stop:1524 length:525 start_codon:yes stop_codon:yes gene_type:complete
MKLLLKLILIFSLIGITGCSSTKIRYDFTSTQLRNNKIIFTLDSKSDDVSIQRSGPNFGRERVPNIRDIYKESVKNMAEETGLNVQYRESYNPTKGSEIHIVATITKLNWVFTPISATMESYVDFEIDGAVAEYQLIGLFKNMWGGTEKYNLTKSLKNANFKLLKELEKNNVMQ